MPVRARTAIRPRRQIKLDPDFKPFSGVTNKGYVRRTHAGPILTSRERLSGIGATQEEIRLNPKLFRLARTASLEDLDAALSQIRRKRGEEVANW